VSLVAAELERQGIATVAVQLFRMITEKVRPPRALVVPFRHGYPLGEPDNPQLQHRVLRAALDLLSDPTAEPACIREYAPGEGGVQAREEVIAE